MKKFIIELGMVSTIEQLMSLYYGNSGVVVQAEQPRSHNKPKHILRCFHIIQGQDIVIERVDTKKNIADLFIKALPQQQFDRHLDCMGIKYEGDWL